MDYRMYSGSTENLQIRYSFICENCGVRQIKTHLIGGGHASSMDAGKAHTKAVADLHKKLSGLAQAAQRRDYSFLGAQSCSECGYIQSWQLKAYRSVSRALLFFLFLAFLIDLFCIYNLLFARVNWHAWIVTALFLLGTFFLARSALRWRRDLRRLPRRQPGTPPELDWPKL